METISLSLSLVNIECHTMGRRYERERGDACVYACMSVLCVRMRASFIVYGTSAAAGPLQQTELPTCRLPTVRSSLTHVCHDGCIWVHRLPDWVDG